MGRMAQKGAAVKRLAWLLPLVALAHVGSPDVFLEGMAGPYRLLVAVRPPEVIPGVAQVEVRVAEGEVTRVLVTPLPLTGDASKFPPAPDVAARATDDPAFHTGALWMMTTGSWQVRVRVEGPRGAGEISVPVPAAARSTRRMDFGIGALLAALGLVLAVGIISVVAAAVREAQLEPGAAVDAPNLRRAGRYRIGTAIVVVLMVALGWRWWDAEARAYGRYIYKPIEMTPKVEGGNKLVLSLRDPGWIRSRTLDDFALDHNHPMHLVVATGALDRIWHLHPVQSAPARFEQALPDMPAGDYLLWADVVHQAGFPETMTAAIALPEVRGSVLEGDDSAGLAPSRRIEWANDGRVFPVKRLSMLRFRTDQPPEPYMGMAGHVFVIKRDKSVFAHLHPGGSVPMAAMALTREVVANPHALHVVGGLSFPYGFPTPGAYRVVVQARLDGLVETGFFEVEAR